MIVYLLTRASALRTEAGVCVLYSENFGHLFSVCGLFLSLLSPKGAGAGAGPQKARYINSSGQVSQEGIPVKLRCVRTLLRATST